MWAGSFSHKVHISPHCFQSLFGLSSFEGKDDVFVVCTLLRSFGGEELSVDPSFVFIGHVSKWVLQSRSSHSKQRCLYNREHLHRHLSVERVRVK